MASAASTSTISTAMNHAHHGNSAFINIACGFNAVISKADSMIIERIELIHMIFNAIAHKDECVARYCIPQNG